MTERDLYFDWAATSPADEDILKDALNAAQECWGNPSSAHSAGKKARALLEEARKRAAAALGVDSGHVYFTSGGTESNQIPLLSVMTKPAAGTVLVSAVEHPAVREQAMAMRHCGWKVAVIPSDKNGIITPDAVISSLTKDTMIVCVMAVNNETGAIQPIHEIADALTEACAGGRRPKLHVDCVQAAGKIRLDIARKGIDSAAFSAHKICGPRGIGILYSKDSPEPFLRGGGQEKGVRSGTENVFGAVAFSKCLERYHNKDEMMENQRARTERFLRMLATLKGCTVVPESRLENPGLYSPFIVQAGFDKIPGNVMVRAMDARGICISTGSACSTRKNVRPVLEAMGVSAQLRESAVRFSFGPGTTQEAMDELFDAVREVCEEFNSGR